MDLIRDSTFFSTLLHCVLAVSLPLDRLAQNTGSQIPYQGILQTPSYSDKNPQTEISKVPSFVVNPNWYNGQSSDRLDLVGVDRVKDSQPTRTYKPELPGTTLKGIGLKYPLVMPRVKLNFSGFSGMLPVKIIENKEPRQLKLPKVPKPAVQHAAERVKPELNPTKLDYPTTPSELYGQIPLNNFQSYKPELPGINPEYPTTNPGLHYVKDLAENIQQSPQKTYVPDIPMSTPSYPMQEHHGSELPVDAIQHTVPYKASLPIGVLNPTNLDYMTTKPVSKEGTAIELPPVPTTMSLLRRTQLVLLNTVAGLPGGNPQALEAIRA